MAGVVDRGVLGIIVAGGGGPLDMLGGGDDAALTPFGGKYRFVDFALATLANSGVTLAYVVAPAPTSALRAHVAGARRARGEPRRPFVLPLARGRTPARTRTARLLRALARCRDLVQTHRPEAVVVLLADHILQVDLRQLRDAHRDLRADVTLMALPAPLDEAVRRTVLRVGSDQRVHEVQHAPLHPATAPGSRSFALGWAGDLMVSAAALPRLLAAVPTDGVPDDDAGITDGIRAMAYDVLESRLPGRGPSAYWHEPTTVEAYYAAQMDLCTPCPALDLYNPAWPVPPVASGLGPAKVVADSVGRPGQALNSLVSDGAVIRGGTAISTVLGHGVVIESGAEVEDSVLLDGCRIGRGARVRRALVGAGAVIADDEQIGYGEPAAPALLIRSGLTLVPAAAPAAMAAARAS